MVGKFQIQIILTIFEWQDTFITKPQESTNTRNNPKARQEPLQRNAKLTGHEGTPKTRGVQKPDQPDQSNPNPM